MVCPALIWMFFINIVPMFGIIMAFQDFNPGKGILRSEFVGLENFRYMFEMKDVLQIFVNTIVIAVFKLILNVAVPVAFALLLNEIKNVYFKRTVQTIVYLPISFPGWLWAVFFWTYLACMALLTALYRPWGWRRLHFSGGRIYFGGWQWDRCLERIRI